MDFDTNIYTSPEKYGLTVVGEVDWGTEDYGFNLTVVWKSDETEKLYLEEDRGCSCPAPFERYSSVQELEEVTPLQAMRRLEYNLENMDDFKPEIERKAQMLSNEIEKLRRSS